jgi:site-specific DNA-cytosine methylase
MRTVAYCEIEAFAIANLVSKMEAGLLDAAPVWSNLKTFDFGKFRGLVDIISGGYPCFRAGTIICTYRGFIPIEQVVVGDMVLTHLGRWRRVTATMSKSGAPVRRIKAQGVPGVVCTDEHPFYTRDGWKDARDLSRGDRIGQVLPDVVENDRSPEFWWVIGRYLADGWRQKSKSQSCGRITICCNHDEADALQGRISAAGFTFCRNRERTVTRFAIVKKELYEFCGRFGKGASGKHLPGWVLELDRDRARALCEGYFSGDGYRCHRSGSKWRITTVSRGLAISFALLAQRAFGVVASLREYESTKNKTIEGRVVNQRNQYFLIVPDRNRSGKVDGSYGWKYVRSNEPCGVEDVYNIAVEEDESYCADGAIVHNCQPFSAAGKRKGKEDPRHLWPWIASGIKDCQPGLCLFENVEGHISIGLPTVVSDLEEMGYTVSWGIFSAAEVGAPHQRKRVFILGARDGWMADPALAGLQARVLHELRAREGQGQGPAPCAHTAGGRDELADAPRDGRKQGRAKPKGRKGRPAPELGGEDVADRDGEGLEGQPGHVDGLHEPGRVCAQQDGPATPCCVRPWPARPGQQQFWWEPPRVVGPVPAKLADFCAGDEQQGGDATQAGREVSGARGESHDPVSDRRPGLRGGDQGYEQEGDLAHARGDGQHRGGEQEPRGVEGPRGVEPDGRGQRGPGSPQDGGEEGQEPGEAQRPLGGDPHGRPDWMDHAELYTSCDNRTDELRLLGNGVVPATVERAFRVLIEKIVSSETA